MQGNYTVEEMWVSFEKKDQRKALKLGAIGRLVERLKRRKEETNMQIACGWVKRK